MADSSFGVRIGFLPAMRFPFSHAWCSKMRQRTLDAATKVPGLTLVAPDESVTPYGVVQNDDQAQAAIAFFKTQNIDGLLIGAMDFGDEISAATVAKALGKPTMLFSTKEGPARPDGERVSDAFCGTLSIGVALRRRKVPFLFAGNFFPEEDAFVAELSSFTSVVAGAKAFLGARLGQVGVRPERFETVAFDEKVLLERFGTKIIPVELFEVVRAAQAIGDDDARLAGTKQSILAEATMVNINDRTLTLTAKFELALKDLVARRQLSGLGLQCWPALGPMYGIAACSTMGRLTGQGIMAACEVDILGALDMVTQYNMVLRQRVPFFIDWTIQHRSRPNTLLAWHCGNGPTALRQPDSDVLLRNRRRSLAEPIPDVDPGAGLWEFAIAEGPVTISRLVEYEGEFKMLVTGGTVVNDPQRERGTSAWVEVDNLEQLYGTLVEEGFLHHASMIHGDLRKSLGQLCKLLGIKVINV